MYRGGFSLLFPVSAAIMGIGFVLFFFIKAPVLILEKNPLVIRDLFEKNAIPASLTIVMFMMTFGAAENFIAKFGASAGLPGGLYFLVMAFALIVTRAVFGKFTDRNGEGFFVYVGNLAMLISFVILAVVPGMFTFFLSALLTGFAFGGLEPALVTMAVRLAPPSSQGGCKLDIPLRL